MTTPTEPTSCVNALRIGHDAIVGEVAGGIDT